MLPIDRFTLEPFVIEHAGPALARCDDETVALFAPRVWAALDEIDKQNPRALQARYVIDDRELDELARSLGWVEVATTR